jgi:hypothetical protein
MTLSAITISAPSTPSFLLVYWHKTTLPKLPCVNSDVGLGSNNIKKERLETLATIEGHVPHNRHSVYPQIHF